MKVQHCCKVIQSANLNPQKQMNGDKHDHISILQHSAESCVTPLHQNIPNPAFMIRGLSIESQNSPNLSVFISADLVILHSGKPLCAASVPSSFSSPLIPSRSYASSSVPQPSVPLFANRAIPRVRTEPDSHSRLFLTATRTGEELSSVSSANVVVLRRLANLSPSRSMLLGRYRDGRM